MVNTNFSVASLLSNVYNSNANAMTQSLSRLASGKRVVDPSDDFAGYMRASGMQTTVTAYANVKQDLQAAKSLTDYARTTGNQMVEDFTRLGELKSLWEKANDAGDTTKKTSYQAEFDAVVARITDATTNATYDGVDVYKDSSLGTVSVNAENSGLEIDIAPTAFGDITAGNADDITSATAAADIQTELNNAQTYVAQVTSFGKEIENAMKLADVAVASKKAAISAIMDVDEVQEMSNLTNLQVRQQASVAMMAQANTAQAGIARLFM